jgi:CheY-like chemotaxis protein
MTGERVLEELSNNSATREIPVIIATARDLTGDERHKLQRKARLVLSKSNLNAELLPAVDGVFKNSSIETLRLS